MNYFETKYMYENKWTEDAKAFFAENHEDLNSAYIKRVENGLLLPQKNGELPWGIGGCLDANDSLVEESTVYSAFGGKYSYDNEEVEIIEDSIIYIPIIPKHWGHFLIDTVSRLWVFLDQNYPTDNMRVFYNSWGFENNEISGNYKRFLELMGIYERMEPVDHCIRAKEIWIPSYSMSFSKTYHPCYKTIFDYVTQRAMKTDSIKNLKKYKNIYFSRTQLATSKMKEIGEMDLENIFKANGFKILYPEKMSLEEQIFYFQTSDIVCAMSGTIMHNIGFADESTKLFILNRTCMMNHPQLMLNRLFPYTAIYIDAYKELTTHFPRDYGTGPFWLEPNANLKCFLKDYGFESYSLQDTFYLRNSMKYFASLVYFSMKYNNFTKFVYYSLMKIKK